ncbi:MAG TPA: single-stranded DNA-binding protein [Nitrosomonas sp.]|nr:single-stranded DNA-binding protein [Nitrosomonas sp.]
MTILTGLFRLGRDAELNNIANGSVANLSLAYNYGLKGEDGKKPTQWIRATLWGKQADGLAPYLIKGTMISAVVKDVHIEVFQGKNGESSALVGTVTDIEFVPTAAKPATNSATPAQRQNSAPKPASYDDFDDSIPF